MVRIADRSRSVPIVTRQSLVGLDWLKGDIGELRRAYETACRVMPERAAWQAIEIDGRLLGLLIHRPSQPRDEKYVIIYFHGGGWIVGSPLTHADISGALCELTGIEVISVDYRLAPEHVAPAPIEDGLATIEHVLTGMRDRSVILCGDSAGAAIALAVASRYERIEGVAACYGSYGLFESESLRLFGSRANGIDADCIRRMWMAAHASSEASPYSIEELAGTISVPVYVLTGNRDPVRDDSLVLANALKVRGGNVVLDVVRDQGHGFLHGGLGDSAAASALTRISHWMMSL